MADRNKAIFSLIYQLLKIDNEFDFREKKYLDDLAKSLNLSSEDIKKIILNPDDFKLVPPPSEQERMMILYYILFAIRIDEHISSIEESYIYETGIKLGFREMMLNDMINVMKQHLNKRLAPDILISVIRKYMN